MTDTREIAADVSFEHLLHHPGVQPFLDEPQDSGVGDAMLNELDQLAFIEIIEKAFNICVEYEIHLLLQERIRQCIQRLMLATSWAKSIRKAEKIFLVDLIEDRNHGLLDCLVLHSRNPQWA